MVGCRWWVVGGRLKVVGGRLQVVGESGHGSDGRIVRATQISQKYIKIGMPASMCIFSLYRCMFHPIMRLD